METFAVVTGASMGLGRSIALELAKRKINLILVSLPGEGLGELSERLSRDYAIQSIYYETDFTVPQNVYKLADWINESYNINILINNAGLGGTKSFLNCTTDYINSIIQINVAATSILIHRLLPNLIRQKKSYITNISSVASYCPCAYKTVYPASKKFISYLTRSLREELKKTNVSLSLALPGPMASNKEVEGRINQHRHLGKFLVISPDIAAKKVVAGLFGRKRHIIMGFPNWLSIVVLKYLPTTITVPMLSKSYIIEMDKN